MIDRSWKTLPSGNLTNRSRLIIWSRNYTFSCQGLLHLAEIVTSFICTYLIMIHCRPAYSDIILGFAGTASETYFMVANFICFTVTFLHYITCVVSEPSYVLLSRTFLIMFSHAVMFLICIITSSSMLFSVGIYDPPFHPVYGFNWKLAASILGMFSSVMYLVSTCLAYHFCKISWLQ